MIAITFFVLLSSVFCGDVYRFSVSKTKTSDAYHYCDKDRIYRCESSETCCSTGLRDPERYKCCSLDKATCCKNGNRCCPESYICSSSSDSCTPNLFTMFLNKRFSPVSSQKTKTATMNEPISDSTKMISVQIPLSREIQNLTTSTGMWCPDGQMTCTNKQTCCPSIDGIYGCCPSPQAVCCSDYQHCCPFNTICNVNTASCYRPQEKPLLRYEPPVIAKKIEYFRCPDIITQCHDQNTCCQLKDESYGCCPEPNGICCPDRLHCCPHGTICNLLFMTCDQAPVRRIIPNELHIINQWENPIMCPDNKSQCDYDQTCCLAADGSYGCCPAINAVCCSDRVHCCPHNTVCNISASKCDKPKTFHSLYSTSQKIDTIFNSITCPDEKSQCLDNQTCCLRDDGEYTCCPEPHGVCCADKIHCCPQGAVCNIAAGTCETPIEQLLTYVKIPLQLKSVICPDNQSRCDDGQTCCPSVDGSFGCCPATNAVCCSDKIHCCPQGTTCNLEEGTCTSFHGNNTIKIV